MTWRVILAYAVLYLVWGSTYLAMKIAVTTLPPFFAASMRFAASGFLLFVVGRALNTAKLTRAHVVTGVLQGLLLLVLGNASVMWAMKTVPSGVGALIIAVTPVFMALLAGDRRRSTWIGIGVGLIGIAVLVDPFNAQRAVPLVGALILVVAAFAWAVGSLLPRHRPIHPDNATSTGIQMITGAVVQFAISLALHETPTWAATSSSSAWAVVYLAVCGSLIGFTCYGWLLKVEPPSRVATYAYVNPVVAVLLGAALGGEPLTPRVLVAAGIIVAAVLIILKTQQKTPPPLVQNVEAAFASSLEVPRPSRQRAKVTMAEGQFEPSPASRQGAPDELCSSGGGSETDPPKKQQAR